VPTQKVEIYLNEILSATFTAVEKTDNFWELRLDPRPFGLTATTIMRLHHPYACRPSEHVEDSTDTRRLALSVRSMSVVRVLNT
jgi:hypothetical protein